MRTAAPSPDAHGCELRFPSAIYSFFCLVRPMAPAAILRSAARSLHLRQPLEQQRCLLSRRLLSSSVPTERCKNFPSGTRPSNSMEQKKHHNDEEEDINRRLLREIDMVSDYVHGGAIAPWAVSIPLSFLLFVLYNYMQG
ncbi:hypothetical protein BS78_05G238900 [Paspalum vaginatum]|nr:hypothetical protein BS78_05G238900 [Paspalum vaginatum]